MTRFRRCERLLHSLLLEASGGRYISGHRFPSRRRIEQDWNVSNKTAAQALSVLFREGILERRSHRISVLAADGPRRARILARRLLAQPLAPTAAPCRDALSGAGNAETRTGGYLYERLIAALLVEISSGAYPAGRRFLSRRRIELRWGVSAPTVDRARGFLLEQGLLVCSNHRLTVVAAGAIERACLILDRFHVQGLESSPSLTVHRNRLLDSGRRAAALAILYANSGTGKPEYLQSFREEVQQHGWECRALQTDGSWESTRKVLAVLRSSAVEGIAVIDPESELSGNSLMDQLKKVTPSIVSVFNQFEGRAEAFIQCNEIAAGYAAMKVLLEHGHRSIAVVGCNQRDDRREQGAQLCLAEMRYRQTVDCQMHLGRSTRSIARILSHIFRTPASAPSALLVTDTRIIDTVDRALTRSGISVPQDMSVIGCGSREHLWQRDPQPDIVERDDRALGLTAARQLIRLVHGEQIPRAIQIATPYLSRGSVVSVGNQLLRERGQRIYSASGAEKQTENKSASRS